MDNLLACPIEERFGNYEVEYWLSRTDDDALQDLLDGWSGSAEDTGTFAVALVKMDHSGDICDALLETICVEKGVRHPVDAQQTIERLEAQLANRGPMRNDAVREAVASLIEGLVHAAGQTGSPNPS
jgi:hypothetical protein